MVDDFFSSWLPQRCASCGGGAKDLPLCAGCAADLPWNRCACPACALPQAEAQLCGDCAVRPPPFDSAWCALRFAGPVQRGVHALKYHAGFLHARVLGGLMARELILRAAPWPQLLIPVPLHRRRLLMRGYNQARELAREIARTTGIALDACAAVRVRATDDQIGMSAPQRRRNIKGAFEVRRDLSGLHVALLDDVMTTGATLGELARACRAAGAARIEAWAVARVA